VIPFVFRSKRTWVRAEKWDVRRSQTEWDVAGSETELLKQSLGPLRGPREDRCPTAAPEGDSTNFVTGPNFSVRPEFGDILRQLEPESVKRGCFEGGMRCWTTRL